MADVNRELRIAPVMTGGTSLAVWMGGVTFELYRMVRSVDGDPAPSTGSGHARKASAAGRAIYQKLLDLTETQPIVDVITGTSAGGLNGSLLAAATHLGVDTNQFASTRDTWLELANIEALLRKPSEASPPSLLKGDDYFAPQVAAVLRRWDKRAKAPELRAEVDLVTTVTTITPEPDSRSDHFGEQLNEATHAHRLWFRAEHFGDDDWIDKLAIASRTSASIPGVFEPSYLPVGPEDADASGRPDFKPHATFATSRWAVDGGVVVNLPLTEALERIFHRTAVGEVRRVVLYVSPTPSAVEDSKADAAVAEPTVLDAALTVVVAPRAEGVATDVDRLNRHNDHIRRQRQSRRAAIRLLGQLDVCEEPDDEFTRGLLAAYAEVRASTSVASTIERLDAATSKRFAHRRLELQGDLEPARRALVADGWAFSKATQTWSWGIQPVEQAVSHALSLLNRALVLPRPDNLDAEACDRCRQVIVDAKNQVHEARKAVERVRCADVKYWNERVRGHAEAHDAESDDEAANNLEEWASTQYAQWPGESLNREEAFATLADAHERVAQALLDAGASIVQLAAGRTGQPDTEREERAALRTEAGGLAALATNGGVQGVQRGLLALHVVQAVFGGHVINNEQTAELMQVSFNSWNGLDSDREPHAKLAGPELGRLGAFVKPSWRANDWFWGRMDGAFRLALLLLEPSRLRRLGKQRKLKDWLATLAAVVGRDLSDDVVLELDLVFDESKPPPSAMPETARFVAEALQTYIAQEELPVVSKAVRDSERTGGNEVLSSDFARAVASEIDRNGGIRSSAAPSLVQQMRIGEETVRGEFGFGLLNRVATNLASVLVNMVTGTGSGIPVVSRFLRPLRAPLQAVTSLVRVMSRDSAFARAVTALVVAISATVVSLAILDVAIPSPAFAIAAGVLIVLLVSAMARSGFVLLGLLTALGAGVVSLAVIGPDLHEIVHDSPRPVRSTPVPENATLTFEDGGRLRLSSESGERVQDIDVPADGSLVLRDGDADVAGPARSVNEGSWKSRVFTDDLSVARVAFALLAAVGFIVLVTERNTSTGTKVSRFGWVLLFVGCAVGVRTAGLYLFTDTRGGTGWSDGKDWLVERARDLHDLRLGVVLALVVGGGVALSYGADLFAVRTIRRVRHRVGRVFDRSGAALVDLVRRERPA